MTQWLEPGPDISVECEWLLHEVTAVADWQFSGTPPCRTLLKTSSHHKQSTDHKAQWAYHQQRNAYMPQRAIWCPPLNTGGGGPNTVERRCSLYCAAISHISLCPWLPRSISILPPPSAHNSGVPSESLASSPVHTAVERSDCERLALPLLIGQG